MKKSKLKRLGKNIQFIRKSQKISQERLAELLKCSRNYIGMIERAEVNTPVSTLFDIAKVLNVDIKTFFD